MAQSALDQLLGTWDLEASFSSAPEPGRGWATFEWELGGRFLLQRSGADHPAAPDGLCIIAPDVSGGGYTQHYFDSRGVVRLYEMTLADGVWTLLRTKPDFTPLDFSQCFTGRFSDDGDRIDGRWETAKDGSSWELDFGLVYTRRRLSGA
ncbi:MAG: hypothetical protein QOG63_486 [Thermoleophilaceae bacterium]|jgi:hypothetical protein|nr:hypothetical protein [Thermoleophilaceae bacterium]